MKNKPSWMSFKNACIKDLLQGTWIETIYTTANNCNFMIEPAKLKFRSPMIKNLYLILIAAFGFLNYVVGSTHIQNAFRSPTTLADTTIFAPDIISIENRTEQAITFSNDGKLAIFSVLNGRKSNRNFWVLMQSVYLDGAWQEPVECPFSGVYSDYGPYFSPNDNALYFTSRRPENVNDTLAKPDYDIWKVECKNGIWDTPKRLANSINTTTEEYSISVSNVHLFICAGSTDTVRRSDFFTINRSDEFSEQASLERMTSPPNSDMWEGGSYIDPNEKFIVFNYTDTTESASEDLYISYFKNQEWTAPKKLNAQINTDKNEFMGALSTNKKELIFSRNGQFYRTKFSKILKNVKAKGDEQRLPKAPNGRSKHVQDK